MVKMITNFLTKLLAISLFSYSQSDVYLHNPRGSNNRCDELTNNRKNANRLFDSQNNAAGGYAISCDRHESVGCHTMSYYEETVLPLRWTSQHNCGESNNCQIILQYACDSELGSGVRDGHPQDNNGNTCTERIPENSDALLKASGLNISKYGLHENYDYYQRCLSKTRNLNLFTADQKLRNTGGIYTRQNPNGGRYGFECPEERDYYPYWGESNWRDIAILTSNTSRCDYYRENSRCNVDKFECIGGEGVTETDCIENSGIWKRYEKYECYPVCEQAPTSVINRLGIEKNSSKHSNFKWKLPSGNHRNCILRIRYNISTNEVKWDFDKTDNAKLKNNPILNTSSNVPVRLAINTAQYGRTFEDRSFTFNIIKRPELLINNTIHNINVQGKRGNIAQIRNCIEYDFVPNKLDITLNEYIHFQFIGSDYNPIGNDGEGRKGTDRSNVAEIFVEKGNIPSSFDKFFDFQTSYTLASIYQPITDPSKCFTFEQLLRFNDEQSIQNCALLNGAPPYFNMFPVKVNKTGVFYMMSSRNNNFSNRGQKLQLNVSNATLMLQGVKETPERNKSPVSITFIIIFITLLVGIVVVVGVVLRKRIMDSIKAFNSKI